MHSFQISDAAPAIMNLLARDGLELPGLGRTPTLILFRACHCFPTAEESRSKIVLLWIRVHLVVLVLVVAPAAIGEVGVTSASREPPSDGPGTSKSFALSIPPRSG